MKVIQIVSNSKFLLTVFFLIGLPARGASSIAALSLIFQNHFVDFYEYSRCTENILRLVEKARSLGIPLTSAKLLRFENSGTSSFGYLNVEQARNSGSRLENPTTPGIRLTPGERNYGHHTVLLFQGFVFDFDFMNQARPMKLAPYIEQMFLDETHSKQNFPVGAERKLKDYVVFEFSALDILSRNIPRRAHWTPMSLREVYRHSRSSLEALDL